MTEEIWNRMSPAEQANTWWQELSAMLQEAVMTVNYTAGNENSVVISGMTTVVGVRGNAE